MSPKFENAPGLKIRARKNFFVSFWQARHDLVKRGYRPSVIALWQGIEPSAEDRLFVSEQCQTMQAQMLLWGRGGIEELPSAFDGTVASLVYCYMRDHDSPFQKLRHGSKINYGHLLKRIERDRGGEKIRHLKARDMLRWHEAWLPSGIPMSHALIRMFRGLLSFGLTILEDDECARLSLVMSKQRFKMGRARTERLTAEQASAIIKLAHSKGLHSIALAQAFQFEAMFRQRDVIGEWVPLSEPGPALDTWKNKKWQRGLVWTEIDASLILRHTTSKRLKPHELDLNLAPMVMEEFERIRAENGGELPKFGPVIKYEVTGRPYSANHFRDLWRDLADECGIPREVQQRDTRAGAISEATDADIPLEHIRHAATHSNIATTQLYSRGSAEKTADVLRLRVEHRNKGRTS